jgi:membrane associated rhomboid family serine protease
MPFARNPRNSGGRLRAPATFALAAALLLVYFGFQGGGLAPGPSKGIEFRCHAVEYGLIPYEVTHPGRQLTDPFCQPQPGDEQGHDDPRTDPGLVADAPTSMTVFTSMFMNGGLLPLAASVLFLAIFGPALERRLGAARFVAVFVLSGLAAAATLVALAPNLPIVTIGSAGAVTGVIGAHLVLLGGSRLTAFEIPAPALLGAWILAQLAVANLDAAQPVAGAGGDVAYVAAAGGLVIALLLSIPKLAPEVRLAQHRPH